MNNCVLQAESMIESVKEAFKTNLKNLDWMDEETRKSARGKADAITDMIGTLAPFCRSLFLATAPTRADP